MACPPLPCSCGKATERWLASKLGSFRLPGVASALGFFRLPKGRDKVAGGNAPGKRAPQGPTLKGLNSGGATPVLRPVAQVMRPFQGRQAMRAVYSHLRHTAFHLPSLEVTKRGLEMSKDEEISGPDTQPFGLASQVGWESN